MAEPVVPKEWLEAWLVECGKDRSLFGERERAELYTSTRRDCVISPLVRSSLLVQALRRIAELEARLDVLQHKGDA